VAGKRRRVIEPERCGSPARALQSAPNEAVMTEGNQNAPRMVQCVKLGVQAEGLARPPFRNALGQRIFESVSKDAWKKWLEHSTMIINEYRLELGTKRADEVLLGECEKFFFGEGAAPPPDFKPQS
jgi:Fe-S cluster biosynthesis and repair protein YggX